MGNYGSIIGIGGKILLAAGVIGMFIIADFIAGVTKAQRLGKAYYPPEQKKKKWIWVGIFFVVSLAGAGLVFVASKLLGTSFIKALGSL